MSGAMVVLGLSLLLGMQPIAVDLYLPALPDARQHFNASMPQMQLTLTSLLLAFGLSQLFWGPLSDRFGRKPILLLGLAGFTAAAVFSIFSSGIDGLIVWRIVQGISMGACVMCARALVRDLYTPLEGARAMSKGLTGLGVLACVSGPIGGALTQAFGWEGNMSGLAVFGGASLLLLTLRLQETLPQRNPNALVPSELVRTWWQILRHPTFWAYTLLSTATYTGLFTFLAASSFVFINMHGLKESEYGLIIFLSSLVYISGTFLCRRLIPKLGVRRTVALAAGMSLSAGTLLLALDWMGIHTVWAIVVPYCLFMLGHGVHQPCGQSGAVSPFPHAAGSASALSGFIMMLGAFVMGGWLGRSLTNDATPLIHGMALCTAVLALVAWTLVRWHGEVHSLPVRQVPEAAP